ncbi:unnamed protein product [Malus baccata var. baccata]
MTLLPRTRRWNPLMSAIGSSQTVISHLINLSDTEMEFVNECDRKQSDGNITFDQPILIPSNRGSIIPFTSWAGLGKSIKQLYGQPLDYLTNLLLKQPPDTIIHPRKAKATIWLVEEVNWHTSSHHQVANLWLSDPMHHASIDAILRRKS